MNDYRQPDFFRFGHDSLELVQWVKGNISKADTILDLGAGSGIIGIELANFFSPEKLTLLEVQNEYYSYLETNLKEQLKVPCLHEVILSSFGQWQSTEKYSLIVCNPPYYLPGHGKQSPDERREMARTFKLDDWGVLFALIAKTLKPEGKGCLVIKNDKLILHHLKDHLPENLNLTEHEKDDVVILELFRLHVD